MVRVICPEYTPILIANFISVIFNTVNNEWSLKEETRTGRGVVEMMVQGKDLLYL